MPESKVVKSSSPHRRTVPVKQLRTPAARPKTRASRSLRSPLKRKTMNTKEGQKEETQQDIRQFFPVRGKRKTASELKKLKVAGIEDAVLRKCEEGMEVFYCEEKGYGVKATQQFERGQFICEYSGELLSQKAGKERERKYDADPGRYGSYMYFFQFQDQAYCLDCTMDNGRLGRLLNHSKKSPNVQTCAIGVQGRPCLIFKALRDIKPGEELCYDYGDRAQHHIAHFPWLAR